MPHTPCLGSTLHPAGHTLVATGSRCPACATTVETERTRRKRQRRPQATASETRRRAAAVADWVAVRGWVCPGWQCPAHPSTDLTADHVIPYAVSGTEDGPLTVLCRPCNGRKQANTTNTTFIA